MDEPRYADFFPDDCPPGTAEAANGEAYRCIKINGIRPEDFQNHYQRKLREDLELCSRCAISVLRSLPEAIQFRRAMPRLGKYIAKAQLSPDHGEWKLTDRRSGHINWWAYSHIDCASLFEVVEER